LETLGASQQLDRAGEALNQFDQHYEAACAALQEELTKGRAAA
jgi:hypothetical protein